MQTGQFHGINYVGHKCLFQQQLGIALVNASCTHIEELHRIQLSCGGTVATLHVIVINLQLWLGVNLCLRGAEQVAVALVRVGVMRSRADKNPSGKGTT